MKDKISMTDTDKFDARHGFKRWILPGITLKLQGHPQAKADIWTDREGRLFTRFSSAGYVYHYGILSTRNRVFSDDMKDFVEEFLQDRISTWVIQSIDDSVLNM